VLPPVSTYLAGNWPQNLNGADAVTGMPYDHLPVFLFCGVGERSCGWRRTAKTEADILVMTAEKREHEATCKGGLIAARAGDRA
jgi:hypothetical protein